MDDAHDAGECPGAPRRAGPARAAQARGRATARTQGGRARTQVPTNCRQDIGSQGPNRSHPPGVHAGAGTGTQPCSPPEPRAARRPAPLAPRPRTSASCKPHARQTANKPARGNAGRMGKPKRGIYVNVSETDAQTEQQSDCTHARKLAQLSPNPDRAHQQGSLRTQASRSA